MTQEQGNVEIAKMLGFVNHVDAFWHYKRDWKYGIMFACADMHTNKLRFHSDWNWLMIAVESIEEHLSTVFHIYGRVAYLAFYENLGTYHSESKIDSVFQTVSEFAEKINNNEI